MRRYEREDIVRKTELARRSNLKSQRRLQKMIEDGKSDLEQGARIQINEIHRQQGLLKQELLGMKLERLKNLQNVLEDIHYSSSEKNKDYGKNYHGYRSCPGSNLDFKKNRNKRIENRKIEKKENLEALNLKAGNEVLLLRRQRKLEEERKKNETIKNKLNNWLIEEQIRSIKEAKDREAALLKQLQKNKKKKTTQKYLAKNVINEKKESSVVKLPPVDGRKIKTYFPKLRNVEGDEILKLPKFDENSSEYLTHSQIYAPDGRIRKAYRMPDFTTSYNKCKSLTYLRPTIAQQTSFQTN